MKSKNAVILGLAVIIAAIILGSFFYAARQQQDSVRVVGYATSEFEADIIKWSFTLSTLTTLNGLEEGYIRIREKYNTFQQAWDKLEIETSDFNTAPVSVFKQYGEYGTVTGYTLEQKIFLVSGEMDKIEEIAINPAYFSQLDLAFEYSRLEYFSSHLPEIKKELLAAATRDAQERAQEIVSAADTRIVKMRSARAGVFQITEPYSTDIAGYGIHQTSTRRKNIKVTVTAEFIIE
jgi:hypothetical protein